MLGTLALLLGLVSGCATAGQPQSAPTRQFDFRTDTFSFSNQLVWAYEYDANGKWTTHRRQPRPTYTQHCFLLARLTRQFFRNATFTPNQPIADEATYRRLIRRLIASNPRKTLSENEKIIIPGYPDLRAFSQAQEKLLKAESGSGWRSYFQRGHWRVVIPFSRHGQERTAQQLLAHLEQSPPVVAHLVRFPQCTINHAVILFGSKQTEKEILFLSYDTNTPSEPITLTYDRATRTFLFAANDYFPGGRVDVYEVYHKWNY
jgi:hypothetical protein